MWLDATQNTYQDTGGTTPAVADRDVLARVNDRSGNSRHATQSNSLRQPVLSVPATGGLSALLCDSDVGGSGEFLALASNLSLPTLAFTVYCVCNLTDTKELELLIGPAGNTSKIHLTAGGTIQVVDGGSDAATGTHTGNFGDSVIRIRGTSTGTVFATATGMEETQIGSSPSMFVPLAFGSLAGTPDGSDATDVPITISEVQVFDSDLVTDHPETDISVLADLATKYGVSL